MTQYVETKDVPPVAAEEDRRRGHALRQATTEEDRLRIRIAAVQNKARQQLARDNRVREIYGEDAEPAAKQTKEL